MLCAGQYPGMSAPRQGSPLGRIFMQLEMIDEKRSRTGTAPMRINNQMIYLWVSV